jgi:MYXO-CTERM domain-containing protein
MKSLSSLLIASAVIATASAASADVIAGWSMPTAVAAATTGTNYTYGAADLGALTSGTSLSGYHALAATTWSSPAGNGSTYSLSSNTWTTGDYYQVSMATTGYSDISVSWDQTRSGSGPATFSLTMSTDGGANFTTLLATYNVVQAGLAGTGTSSWSPTGSYQTGFTTTTIVGISAANKGNILLRFNSLSTPAAGGTNRIDNISVTGAVVPVPTPGAIALIGLAGLVARRRR